MGKAILKSTKETAKDIKALNKTKKNKITDKSKTVNFEKVKQSLKKHLVGKTSGIVKELKNYLPDFMIGCVSIFPDELFIHLFRLNGWSYTLPDIKKYSDIVSKLINVLIFDELSESTIKELKNNVASKQMIDNSNLSLQIGQIITLLKLSDNMKDAMKKFDAIRTKHKSDMDDQSIRFDSKGHAMETIIPDKDLSPFNQALKMALNFNPKSIKKK